MPPTSFLRSLCNDPRLHPVHQIWAQAVLNGEAGFEPFKQFINKNYENIIPPDL